MWMMLGYWNMMCMHHGVRRCVSAKIHIMPAILLHGNITRMIVHCIHYYNAICVLITANCASKVSQVSYPNANKKPSPTRVPTGPNVLKRLNTPCRCTY
jgi:hypothetical protein